MNTIKEVASQSFRIDESNNVSTKGDSRKRQTNFYESCGDSSLVMSTRQVLSPKPKNISDLDRFQKINRSHKMQIYDRVPAKEITLKRFHHFNIKWSN